MSQNLLKVQARVAETGFELSLVDFRVLVCSPKYSTATGEIIEGSFKVGLE